MRTKLNSTIFGKGLTIALVIFVAVAMFAVSSGVARADSILPIGLITATANTAASASTQSPSAYGCNILGADPCTAFVDFALTAVSAIMGLLIALGGFLIQIGMQLTSGVYSSQATQSGFGAVLAIANLIFILAIIVIAIATILRSETYGYKKVLWRLIAMAILINFGLVITAPIVGFANSMTNYFVASIGNGASGTNAIVSFSNKLMQSTNASALQGAVPNNTNNTGGISIAGGFFQTILSLVFIIIFKGLIGLTFILLGLLLFIRYIYLIVLLVMLPLAWVTWIFPNFSHQFGEWWKKFIHWTFFPPAAMFFVWLAVNIQNNFVNSMNTQNGPAAALGLATGLAVTGGTSAPSILAQVVDSMVVIGIMIGGLMAASKLAGSAGSFAVAQGKAVSGAVTGYVGRRASQLGKRAATAPLRTKLAKNVATRLQQRSDVGLLRWTGANWLGRKAGQGLEAGAIAGGSKAVDSAAERFKGLSKDQKINHLTGVEVEAAAPQRMALLKQILEDKNINKLSLDEMERYFGKKQEDSFKAFGQEKLFKDLREKSGLSLKEADRELADLKAKGAPAKDIKDKETERNKLLASYIDENGDAVVDAFSDPAKIKKRRDDTAKSGRIPASLEPESLEALQRSVAQGIAGGLSTQNVSSIMKDLAKKNNLDGFKDAIDQMKASSDPAIMAIVADMRAKYAANIPLNNWNRRSVDRGDLNLDLNDIYS